MIKQLTTLSVEQCNDNISYQDFIFILGTKFDICEGSTAIYCQKSELCICEDEETMIAHTRAHTAQVRVRCLVVGGDMTDNISPLHHSLPGYCHIVIIVTFILSLDSQN